MKDEDDDEDESGNLRCHRMWV